VTNRKALLVCYYFPPLGGAGVGRPLALFKHLPRRGYDCDVLTVKPVAYRVYEPELLEGLDTSRVYRAGSRDPQRLMHLLGIRTVSDAIIRRGRKLSDRFFPDPKIGWVKPAVLLGRTLCSNNRYDVILSTSPPISSHLVAKQLSHEYRAPWVADFRDFWTLHKAEEVFKKQNQVERALNLLRTVRQQASVVTAVNPSTADYVNADEVIYNSYDSDLARLWQPPRDGDYYIIGLLGTLNEIYPVEPLLKVVAAVREKSRNLFEKIRLLQVGSVNINWLRPQLDKYGLWDRCDIHLLQKRADTISILSQASLFYIGLSSPREKGVILGRAFTILASGRPILAAVPPGSEIEKLIGRVGRNGLCFTDNDISGAAGFLCQQITLFETNALDIIPLPVYAREFSSENLAKNFARLFDQL
jgi:glycosyltransferase involved in cell wall biosynthesis